MKKHGWEFNGVIKCHVTSIDGGGKTYWYADVSLTTGLVTIDDIHVLQDFFPFSANLLVTQSESKIVHIESIDLLMTICHHFSICILEIMKHSKLWETPPLYWGEERTYDWQDSVVKRIHREGA